MDSCQFHWCHEIITIISQKAICLVLPGLYSVRFIIVITFIVMNAFAVLRLEVLVYYCYVHLMVHALLQKLKYLWITQSR